MNETCVALAAKPGPWGKIEYDTLILTPPPSYFDSCLRDVTRWGFLGQSREKAEDFLDACGVDVAELARSGRWLQYSDGVVAEPDHAQVAKLTATTREKLYPRLLEWMGNQAYLNEFVVEGGSYRSLAQGLNIPKALVELVEERSVRIGDKMVFPETAFALSQIPEPATRTRFLQGLCRHRAILARLLIDHSDDLETIAQWWKAGPNRSRALPLLETAARTRGVNSLDLIHLLPPVPRRLINTYPRLQSDHNGTGADCFWAAMNFFRETPASRYLDVTVPRQYYFAEHFGELSPGSPRQFGDVILMVDEEKDRFIHAYIHIADEIVFTKNGSGKFFPFVLSLEKDLLSRYAEGDHISTVTYRMLP